MGHDVKTRALFEVKLRYQNRAPDYGSGGWGLIASTGADGMPEEIEKEMFRQFAAHKARYLNKRKSSTKLPS